MGGIYKFSPRQAALEIGNPPRAEGLQLRAVAIERVPAHIEAKGFLLAGELLRLGPGRRIGKRRRHGVVVGSPAEEL